jgi:hypothetical protein
MNLGAMAKLAGGGMGQEMVQMLLAVSKLEIEAVADSEKVKAFQVVAQAAARPESKTSHVSAVLKNGDRIQILFTVVPPCFPQVDASQ